VLRKEHLRVSRAGGGYHPQFTDEGDRALAASLLGTFQGHVGEPRSRLRDALDDAERGADSFKLVRGLAALLEREATFETQAPVPPRRTRRVVFESAESVGVASDDERTEALSLAASRLGVDTGTVESSLYADREENRILAAFEPRWDPETLLDQYDLSLAQTALFDATEVRVRSSEPADLVRAVKRLGLMYEVQQTDEGRELVVTGPDSLFRATRRYGTSFARLLRSVAKTDDWRLSATIDDRGRERTMTLTDDDVSVPGVDPVAEPTYDSAVESEFAAAFESLDTDWDLVREPEPLATGTRVMIPDFAFDYAPAGAEAATVADRFRVYFEIMGFWTPEYVEKKLSQLETVEDVELLVAVDESLAASEAIEARDHRAVPYSGSVRVKDVLDALREFETDLVADAAADLPEEMVPEADAVSLEELAADHGVSVDAVDGKSFPEHRLVGRTLVRPAVLEEAGAGIEAGMALSAAEERLAEYGLTDVSAALSALGYRVEWDGLSGGTVREKTP
jgi:predicted nuclease of restriction endonuclease-like RecB superfamily